VSFLYPFVNFLQPGILWPALADLRPSIIMSIIGLFVGLSMRSDYSRAAALQGKVFMYLVLFVFVQAISLYYSGMLAMLGEFFFWYQFPLFVAISILLMPSVEAMRRYVWGIIVGSMFVVLYGIYAVFAWGGYEGTGRAGAYGMYDNHNDYTFIIIQIVPFIYTYLQAETSAFKRLLLRVFFVACLAGVALSLSRGGMIALVLELVLIIALLTQGRKRLILLPIVAAVGIAAVSYQYTKRAENQGSGYTAEDAESSRIELWKAGVNMLIDRPLLGVGSRRFPEFSRYYYDLSHDQIGKVSHNTYIEIFSSSGLLGFAAFMLMIRWLIRELRRLPSKECPPIIDATRKGALIALYAILFRALLDAKVHDWCFYVLCAIGITCSLLQRKFESEPKPDAGSPEPTIRLTNHLPPRVHGA
jgi:O-antigen ligase